MKAVTKDMTSGKPLPLIISFAIPLMIGNLFQQFYTITDSIVVGRGVGVEALASLGAADWINWMVLWMVQGFTQGFSVLIAQHFGAGRESDLKKCVAMSIRLSAILAAVFTAGGMLAANPLLHFLNTPDNILAGAKDYLYIIFSGIFVIISYNMASAILRALGDGKTPLKAMVTAGGINIVLDLIFVMWFDWGIKGAAAATVIAQVFSFLYCLNVIRKISMLHLTKSDFQYDKACAEKLWKLGIPVALQNGIIAVGGMVVQYVINGFGFLFVAGFTATNKLYGLLECTSLSLGYSMTTYMGQNLGAGKLDRIESGMKSAVKLTIATSLVISVFMILTGKLFLSLFISATPEQTEMVLGIAYRYLFIMSCMLVFLYLLHCYRSALQGLGNTLVPMGSGIVELFMRVGAALILPVFIGETGIFLAEVAAWMGAAIYLILYYYKEVAKIKVKLERAAHGSSV